MKKQDITSRLALIFVALLVGGTVVFLVSGRDLLLRAGFVGGFVVVLLWLALLTIRIIRDQLRSKRYFELATTVALHGGIMLLVTYFFWFFLSEMLGVYFFGPVPPVKTSKLAILGGCLVFLSMLTLFIAAAFGYKKNSRRH